MVTEKCAVKIAAIAQKCGIDGFACLLYEFGYSKMIKMDV